MIDDDGNCSNVILLLPLPLTSLSVLDVVSLFVEAAAAAIILRKCANYQSNTFNQYVNKQTNTKINTCESNQCTCIHAQRAHRYILTDLTSQSR
jgi:hypothetical protein